MIATRTCRHVLAVFSLAATAGCTMIPHYTQPAPAVATQYPQAQPAGATDVAALPWRQFYLDASLQKVIALALDHNQDLRVSVLNIEKARAQYRIARADLLPTLNAGGSGDVVRYPTDVSPTGHEETSHAYSVDGAVASYELDIFGRVRSLSQEALNTYFGMEQTRRAFQISLISEVAQAWYTYQADANLAQLSAATLASEQRALQITTAKHQYGTGALLDVTEAEQTVRTAQASLAQYQRLRKQDVNALTLLVGATLPADLLAVKPMDTLALNDAIAPGMPSALLTRRPDILAAEDSLKAANADIGAARAAFFPRITLTASGGTESARLGGLFHPGSGAWSFAPSISIPIFDYGRNSANLKVSKTERAIALATYQKTIQTAFREVADALDGIDTWRTQETATQGLVDASRKSWQLSQAQYDNGVAEYLTVLTNQRTFFAAQQSLIQTRLARVENTLTLYAALGGGWNDAVPHPSVP